MERLAASVGEPETIVVISPHTDGYGDAHVVKTAPRLRGDFGRFRCPEVAFSYDNDVPFAELLLALAGDYRKLQPGARRRRRPRLGRARAAELPARPTASSRSPSSAPTPSTARWGSWCGAAPRSSGGDTLFLASGDLSHALIHGAPAPYDPRGKLFDDEVVEPARRRRLRRRSRASSPSCCDGAAECGLRSFIALGGFLGDDATVDPEILSYEGPFGVGYLVARFGAAPPSAAPRDERPGRG